MIETRVPAATVNNLVAYAFAADLDRTAAFYAHLGFAVVSTFPEKAPPTWMEVRSGKARLFFEQASEPIDDGKQGVLFYAYTKDIAALRERLISAGIEVSPIDHPAHMPAGQMRCTDPDGYAVLVGQLRATRV